MEFAPHSAVEPSTAETEAARPAWHQSPFAKWAIVLIIGFGIAVTPPPSGITSQSWRLLAIFVATIIGSIVRPVPGGAMVLIGVSTIALTGTLPVDQALGGYADPIVWMVLAAFFISRGMIKTGLGRRRAFLFIRAIGPRVSAPLLDPLFRRETKGTPAAAAFAEAELKRMGQMS